MKDLSPEARALIDSHWSARSLTQADRSRMKQKVMLRVSTLGASTALAGTAAGMSLASKVVLVALGVTGMVGAGAVSVRTLRSRAVSDRAPTAMVSGTARQVVAASAPLPEPGPAMAPVPEPGPAMAPRIAAVPPAHHGLALSLRPRAVSPRHAAVAARATTMNPRPEAPEAPVMRSSVGPHAGLATNPRVERAVALSASSDAKPGAHPAARDERASVSPSDSPSPRAPQSPSPAAAPVALPDPEPELQGVREARDDLRAGRPASAYRRLEALDRQSRGGMLVQERSALAAIALCQSQPGPVAQARAADFLRRSPESPLATRVRAACKQTGRVDR